MSAIREWFGIYNMLFRHMKDTFGEDELKEYLKYLGDTAYKDVSDDFSINGLERICERYTANFVKDGGKASASMEGEKLVIGVDECPAFNYMLNSENPYDKPEEYYCDCCCRLQSRVLENAGYELDISDINHQGSCKWTVLQKGTSDGK
jgi:hypothetical protein